MLLRSEHYIFRTLEDRQTGMVTIIMSNIIISTAHVVIVMFNTQLDDFNLCRFELSTMYDDLFEDAVCKQNELH